MTVALVTDSNAQLPPSLRERYAVRVVPLTVRLDGVDFREGLDLDADMFYARLAEGAKVTTAAPSAGEILVIYRAAAEAGATEVVSVHLGSSLSATVAAARVAAKLSPVPVTVVDTGTASFAIACCVWEAGEVLAAGGSADAAAVAAMRVAAEIGNVFVVGALGLAHAGGRLAAGAAGSEGGVPVLALEDAKMRPLQRVSSVPAAMDAMVAYVGERAGGVPQRIGVGDAVAESLGFELAARLAELAVAGEVVRYAVGPSVGAHTGAGTVGAVFYPVGPPAT